VTDWQGADSGEHEGAAGLEALVRGADPNPDPYQNVTDWQGADSGEHEGAAGLEALVRGADPDSDLYLPKCH
jgi:hypothetical protein